jgi:hypothetical protein
MHTPAAPLRAHPSVDLGNGRTLHVTIGRVEREQTFASCNGIRQFESRLTAQEEHGANRGQLVRDVCLFTTDRVEQLDVWKDFSINGSVVNQTKPPWDSLDVALGLRLFDSSQWLRSADLRGMPLVLTKERRAVLRQADSRGRTHVMTFDPDRGYALVEYQVLTGQHETPVAQFTCSDFRAVDGVVVPFFVQERLWYADEKGALHESMSAEIHLHSIRIGDLGAESPPEHLAFPRGAHVVDARTGLQITVQKDKQILDDATLSQELQRHAELERAKRTDAAGKLKDVESNGPRRPATQATELPNK